MKFLYTFAAIFLLIFTTSCNKISSVAGYVYDYDTGRPVKGAFVQFYDKLENSHIKTDEVIDITDINGRYLLNINKVKLIKSKYNYIKVEKEGYMTFYDSINSRKEQDIRIYLKEL
jgi:hypothetical protein